jgi:hypothetical protein
MNVWMISLPKRTADTISDAGLVYEENMPTYQGENLAGGNWEFSYLSWSLQELVARELRGNTTVHV